jgi:hypothetical protein
MLTYGDTNLHPLQSCLAMPHQLAHGHTPYMHTHMECTSCCHRPRTYYAYLRTGLLGRPCGTAHPHTHMHLSIIPPTQHNHMDAVVLNYLHAPCD